MLLPKIWIICRVCLKQQEEMFNIYDDKTEGENIWSLIRDCGGVPVRKNDDLPDKICEECLRSLCKANIFRKACQRGHRELVQMLMETAINMYELDLEDEKKYCCSEIISISDTNNTYPTSNPTKAPPSQTSTNSISHNDDNITAVSSIDPNTCKEQNTLQSKSKQYCVVSKNANKPEPNIPKPTGSKEPIVLLLKLKNIPQIQNQIQNSTKKSILPKETIRKLRTRKQFNTKEPLNLTAKTDRKQNVKKQSELNKTKLYEKSSGSSIEGNKLKLKEFKYKKTIKDNTKFACKICKKSYNSNVLLKHHTYIHNRPYECKICKKRFSQTQSYLSHTNRHTGIKPYYCRFCYKTFADISNRNAHERKMHVTEKFKCDKCHKIFRFLFLLHKHAQCHRPKKCLICNKEFASLQMVRQHHQYAHLKLLKNK